MDQTSALLLEEHDVETIKVGKVPPLLGSLALLSPRGLLPLGDNLGSVEDLLDGRSTCGTGQLLENVRGEDESSVSEGLAGDTSRGTVDESTVVVNDLDDGSELAGRRSVVNENDATDLDVALESGIRGHGYGLDWLSEGSTKRPPCTLR